MVTFSPVVIKHHRNKDGTYPVKIRVYANGKSRWLPTMLFAYPSELTRDFHIRKGELLDKANALIAKMRRSAERLSPVALPVMTVDDVVRWIRTDMERGDGFSLDFFEWGEELVKGKSEVTARQYRVAMSAFRRYLHGQTIDINAITSLILRDFLRYIQGENKIFNGEESATAKRSTGDVYLGKLAHIFREARLRYNDEDFGIIRIPRDPFAAVAVKRSLHKGQRDIPREVIQAMIDDPCEGRMRYALDVFLLSFALMGMNMADLYEAEPPEDGWLTYRRAKTRGRRADEALMKVRIPDEVCSIVAHLTLTPERGRWLSLSRMYATKDIATGCINRLLGIWAESHGYDTFTLYAGRKSFATLSRREGVEKALIDEALNHLSDYRESDVYIIRDDWHFENLSKKCQAVVLRLLDWHIG